MRSEINEFTNRKVDNGLWKILSVKINTEQAGPAIRADSSNMAQVTLALHEPVYDGVVPRLDEMNADDDQSHACMPVHGDDAPPLRATTGANDGPAAQPATTEEVTALTQVAAPMVASVTAFVDSLHLPMLEPIIQDTPRAYVPRRHDDDWLPWRSTRLAAKHAFCDPNPKR